MFRMMNNGNAQHGFALTLLCACAASIPLAANPATADCVPDWDNAIGQPGMSHEIWAFTEFEGDLIAGGAFTTIGGMTVNRIARWDGETWHPMGDGFSNGAVQALAVLDGELIAAGTFTSITGYGLADRIARWDAAAETWVGFGPGCPGTWEDGCGLSQQVSSLTVFNGELVAGGTFVNGLTNCWCDELCCGYGDCCPDKVAECGGCTGETTGTGTCAGQCGGHGLIVGALNRIARWDGEAWRQFGPGFNSGVRALTVYNGELVAGGMFSASGDTSGILRIARWDGSAWQPFANGFGSTAGALIVYNGELHAGGFFFGGGLNYVARWDGSAWQPLDNGVNGGVSNLTEYNGDLIAAGTFTSASGLQVNRIARWDGTLWSAMSDACPGTVGDGCGFSGTVNATRSYNGDLVAGGPFTTAFGMPSNRVALFGGCADVPGIPGDLNGDGSVGVADLLILLANWGPCSDCGDCPADLNGDCSVGVADLLILLANWG